MEYKLDNLTKDDLLDLSSTEKEEIIKEGVAVYIQQVELAALLLELDFLYLLKENILKTEKQIERFTDDEEYELCFFLQEVINRVKEKYNNGL